MIFYSDVNVYDAAKDRIRWLLDEFPDKELVIGFSGGKDSTVILNLTHEVYEERGIPKLRVFFLDQEIEAPMNVEYIRSVMSKPWVEPMWVQTEYKKFGGSSGEYFRVFEKGKKWVREKEPSGTYTDIFIPDNSTNQYQDAIKAIVGNNEITLTGVRIEESPIRRTALTKEERYKDITWGSLSKDGSGTFCPIYDWRCYDVWYYIFSNKLEYCKLYNYYFTQKPLLQCRVASFTDPKSLRDLEDIKEIAPEFYNAVQRRVKNVNGTTQSFKPLMAYVSSLPPYFKDWKEYIYYLAEHLVTLDTSRNKIVKAYESERNRFLTLTEKYPEMHSYIENEVGSAAARCIIAEDISLSQISNKSLTIFKRIKDYERSVKRANQEAVQSE